MHSRKGRKKLGYLARPLFCVLFVLVWFGFCFFKQSVEDLGHIVQSLGYCVMNVCITQAFQPVSVAQILVHFGKFSILCDLPHLR